MIPNLRGFPSHGKQDWPWWPEGKTPPHLQYRLNTDTILSGNVSSALLSTTFYLATHPSALPQLQQLVYSLIDSRTFDPKTAYPFLDAVIFESFRLQPLVPNDGQRVTPLEGLQIGDCFVPGDTIVKVSMYTLFRGKTHAISMLLTKPNL